MRELKFSAWDKKTKKWIFEGFHIMGEVMAFNLIEDYIFANMCGATTSLERWNDIEIVQWINKVDKNGVDLCDGDIVKHPLCVNDDGRCPPCKTFIGEIVYNVETGEYLAINSGQNKRFAIPMKESDKFEKIGNIFENSVLLNMPKACRLKTKQINKTLKGV
jgi:uncharacterized phage protein (TIGR01671 family)